MFVMFIYVFDNFTRSDVHIMSGLGGCAGVGGSRVSGVYDGSGYHLYGGPELHTQGAKAKRIRIKTEITYSFDKKKS